MYSLNIQWTRTSLIEAVVVRVIHGPRHAEIPDLDGFAGMHQTVSTGQIPGEIYN